MKTEALALFDFDGTMIRGDSIVAFLRFAYREKRLGLWALPGQLVNALLGVWGLIPAHVAKSRALAFLSRMSGDEVRAFCKRFCEEILMPALYPKALERLEGHRQAGLQLLIISASPDIYMKHMADLLLVDAVLASPTDEKGRVSSNTKGREKPRRLQAWLQERAIQMDGPASYAYGDSASDLPLMRLCGHPVMINPKSSMKREAAGLATENWRP